MSQLISREQYEGHLAGVCKVILPHVRRLLAEGKTPNETLRQLRADGWSQLDNPSIGRYVIEQATAA